MIGVTGATGEVGGRVARRLADTGHSQLLIVRDDVADALATMITQPSHGGATYELTVQTRSL